MGPHFQTPNSMVDHRSVFVKLNVFDKTIEAVCDSGATVSCLSSDIFGKLLKLGQKKILATESELVAVNKLAVTFIRTIRLPIINVLKPYENEFHVPINSEPDCFLGLNFLRTHMSDLLFSNDWLQLDSKNHVPLYHRKHNHELNTVFRVKATETVSVPAGHAMIWPAWIQERKWPLTEMPAPFDPVVLISTLKKAVVPNVFFHFAENVPFTFEKNRGCSNHGVWKHNIGFLWILFRPSVETHRFRTTKINSKWNWRVLWPEARHRFSQSCNTP